MIKNPAHYAHPFAAVAEQFERARRESAQRGRIYNETKSVIERALAPDVSTLATAILRAGAKARGELADETPRFSNDEAGRRARAIVNAGRKARGQEPI